MNKIIKIVGVWVAAEVIFALGKGHMLANVRRFNPKVGDEIREQLGEMKHDENRSIFDRASCAVICKADDLMTEAYTKRDEKRKEFGERG